MKKKQSTVLHLINSNRQMEWIVILNKIGYYLKYKDEPRWRFHGEEIFNLSRYNKLICGYSSGSHRAVTEYKNIEELFEKRPDIFTDML